MNYRMRTRQSVCYGERWIIAACLLVTTIGGGCSANRPRTRLAVVIVIDMLPESLIERHEPHFGNGGFRRLMKEGAWFTQARYESSATKTGPGHTTIVTGTDPSVHGIIGNQWYEPGQSESVGCTEDVDVLPVGLDGPAIGGNSPYFILAPTIGDMLKDKQESAKIWAMSLKDRGAITLGGSSADAAIWWSRDKGRFQSSSYYLDELPTWCSEFNREKFSDKYFHKSWEYMLPAAAYREIGEDDAPYETGVQVFWTNRMPKILGGGLPEPNKAYYRQLAASPFGNELVLELARRAVVQESLGQDDVTDLLLISLSSNDYCGHTFGPDSHEVMDMTVRTDRQLAAWLEFLDDQVGLDHCVVALTSDHGTAPAPEVAQARGLGGGRFVLQNVFDELNGALAQSLGTPPLDESYITAVDPPWVYLNTTLLKSAGADVDTAAAIVAERAREIEGMADALVVSSFIDKPMSQLSDLEGTVRRAVYPGRSGQVYLHVKPYWYHVGTCAGHGTVYEYDQHVPLFFWGSAFRSGRYDQPVGMNDVAVTLCDVLNIPAPTKATGRVLREALAD